jgi:uncharacterized protein YndB with AHSA1/START domain
MSTSLATEVQTTQVYQLFIKASPERVWEAITKPEQIARYFYGALFDGPPVAGGRWRAWTLDHSQLLNDGEIYEVDPPRRFVHGWKALYDPEMAVEEESRITWEIEPQEGGYSKLTVVHDRLEASPKTAAGVAGGWMMILSGLKTLVETGEPIVDFAKDDASA